MDLFAPGRLTFLRLYSSDTCYGLDSGALLMNLIFSWIPWSTSDGNSTSVKANKGVLLLLYIYIYFTIYIYISVGRSEIHHLHAAGNHSHPITWLYLIKNIGKTLQHFYQQLYPWIASMQCLRQQKNHKLQGAAYLNRTWYTPLAM